MKSIDENRRLLTVGGVETHLLFTQGAELREFCGFDVFRQDDQVADLERTFLWPIADAALAAGFDLLVDVLAWRAQEDFVAALGLPDSDLERLNAHGVAWVRDFAERWRRATPGADRISVMANGDMGPRGDAYRHTGSAGVEEAQGYHRRQMEALAAAGIDLINPLTMTHVDETVAIASLASELGLPCIVSPTVETDGTTPDGTALGQFIDEVDQATGGSPLYYMVNCAHPSHLEPTLQRARERGEPWLSRLRGLRANASSKSHAELDESTELDRGSPTDLATQIAHLASELDFMVVGGCCGTDAEHIALIAEATAPHR